MSDPTAPIPVLDHVNKVAGAYKVWLCDIWGVVHNGLTTFPSACEACRLYRQDGGVIVLISNSPRTSSGVRQQMLDIGASEDMFDAIVTSGDVTRSFIAEWTGKAVYHLGPERDRGVFDGLDVSFSDFENADVVVNTGLFDDETETPDDYADTHASMLSRGLPMICANPDLVVERGDRLVYCAGALADAYAQMGGRVIVGGKPHAPIYETAIKAASKALARPVSTSEVLAIGDSIRTDMTGAHNAGLDALFMASGLHVDDRSKLTSETLTPIFADKPFSPIAAQGVLTW